jgi:hypothetical protein
LVSLLGILWLWRDTGDGSPIMRNRRSGTFCHRCQCSWCCPPCFALASASGQLWRQAAL